MVRRTLLQHLLQEYANPSLNIRQGQKLRGGSSACVQNAAIKLSLPRSTEQLQEHSHRKDTGPLSAAATH